ncbi:unnamed protein product [Gongylonema pulchrum]|uniref:Ig-like domain-containing protein n=1 Tax=Gongylonema pulchrum TaxID=637853 RepID=A0A183EH72_9BILA|nr:unnamed protein product [Gongylonema pulchrum]
MNDSGHYRCHSGTLISDVAVVVVAPTQDVNTTKNVLLKEFPSEMSVPEGGSLILECLPDDPQSSVSWHIVNEYGQPIPKYKSENSELRTAVMIHSASAQDNGKYACVVSGKATRQTIWTFVTVQVAPLLPVKRSVRRITGALGTTTRLRCSASVEPHDASLQINWYKDGKKVVTFGRAKQMWE